MQASSILLSRHWLLLASLLSNGGREINLTYNCCMQGISVVIPNYNGAKLFSETLPTVFIALDKIQLPSEIIISDDCSTDDSVSYLQKNFPEVKIVSNKKNSGFSVTA